MKTFLILSLLSFFAHSQVFQPTGTIQTKPFTDKTGFIYMPDAIDCEFQKSTDGEFKESTCQYQMQYTAKMNGVKIFLKNHAWGDYAYLTVHHPVGDAELGRFGTKIKFNSEMQNQEWVETSYDAELAQGLILRVHYFTKDTVIDKQGIFNFRLHKVVP